MIYITGDTHSDFTRFTEDQFPIQSEMTKNVKVYLNNLKLVVLFYYFNT